MTRCYIYIDECLFFNNERQSSEHQPTDKGFRLPADGLPGAFPDPEIIAHSSFVPVTGK